MNLPPHLVHALRVEPHDGCVGELVEHHPEDGGAVQRLVPQEQLLHEPPVQHRRGDVVQHCDEEGKEGCVKAIEIIAYK